MYQYLPRAQKDFFMNWKLYVNKEGGVIVQKLKHSTFVACLSKIGDNSSLVDSGGTLLTTGKESIRHVDDEMDYKIENKEP